MISLANILFGDKKPSINTKPINSNLNKGQGKLLSQNEKLLGNNTRNYQQDGGRLSNSMNQNISLKNSNESVPKFQEIKKTTYNTNPKPSDNRNRSISYKVSNPKDDSLYSKLKNFNSIDDIVNEVEANKNNQYSKLFKEDKKGNVQISKNEPSKLQGKYKPMSTGEDKLLKKIDEINKIKEGQEISMIGKKHSNKSEINRKSSKYATVDDIWCAKCRQWHDKDVHKPMFPNLKDYMASNSINSQKKVESPMIKTTIPLIKPFSSENLSKTNQFQCQVLKTETKNNFNNIAYNNQKLKNHNEIMQKIKHQIQFDKVASHTKISKEEPEKQINRNNNEKNSSNIGNMKKNTSSSSQAKLDTIKNMITINKREIEIPKHQSVLSNRLSKAPQSRNNYNNSPKAKSRHFQSSQLFSNYSPTNPGGHENFLFSRKDFDDDENFIDDAEEESIDYRKYLDRINQKFRRGGGNYYNNIQQSDSDEVVEAKFDEIEEEEKYTEIIGQKEDEEEEIKEMLEIQRKKLKKSNK